MTRPKAAQSHPADLSPGHKRAAVAMLRRRVDELRNFDVTSVQDRSDPRIGALQRKLEHALASVFPIDTDEYRRFHVRHLDTAPVYIGRSPDLSEVREAIARSMEREITNLNTIIEVFEEELAQSAQPPGGRARSSLDDIDLHPELLAGVGKLFHDGHYANAIEDACKILEGLVKNRSGQHGLSGTRLMQAVFSARHPILKFADVETDSGRSEQEGMMHLYCGASLALRNPRAHELVRDLPKTAWAVLVFLDFLAKALDRATRA